MGLIKIFHNHNTVGLLKEFELYTLLFQEFFRLKNNMLLIFHNTDKLNSKKQLEIPLPKVLVEKKGQSSSAITKSSLPQHFSKKEGGYGSLDDHLNPHKFTTGHKGQGAPSLFSEGGR